MNESLRGITPTRRVLSTFGTVALAGVLALAAGPPARGQTSVEKEFAERLSRLEERLRATDDRLAAIARNFVPIGTILPYGGALGPEQRRRLAEDGWLVCDGSRLGVDAGTEELYRAIGSAFGGDAAGTYFHLPDLRGRFARGVNDGAMDGGVPRDPDAGARTAGNPGGNTGDAVGSVQEDQFKAHDHSMGASLGSGAGYYSGGKWGNPERRTSREGGNETRPKNVYVHWIIKARTVVVASDR